MALEQLQDSEVFPDTATTEVTCYRPNQACYSQSQSVIQETAVAIEFNGIAYTVMMCSPTNLEEFAIGFAYTNQIITHYHDIHDIEISHSKQGITLHIEVANRCLNHLKNKQRSLAGVTGCGICGAEKLDSVCQLLPTVPFRSQYNINALQPAFRELSQLQQLNHKTGASHAAAYCDEQGKMIAIFEDVGRHIALDKLIGFIVRHHYQGGAIFVTSRASYEMVQKVVCAGIEYLFAISAVTQMAIELAASSQLTLGGFCRSGRAEIYSHPQRIVGEIIS
ncbi:formate dehydrogenase accessory sulfurtransferase FdhD [Vibrio aphrogenes]|uniref:formate dehydrogenase accessory sulfurtransferase FdhD n=1 Tax=Vibrio aphrogenes TaxID=1891186 RepID=UPI000B35AEE3|nr:formate dehydrogenase accessory sulfurtransferase FdhD [Vibrio aphrogenes]